MAEVFSTGDVRVVALSCDSVAKADLHRRRDELETVELLSDAKLEAIDTLGLRRPRGLPFKTFYLFGIPLGFPTWPRDLAVPTSILLDAGGVVRWIDQATDYRLRGDRARIENALATLHA